MGLPNAGKSTILRSLSASKAQVGHWRFTTLSPNLGVVRLGSDGSVIGVDDAEVLEGMVMIVPWRVARRRNSGWYCRIYRD